MTSQINRQYQLTQRPSGLSGRDTFSFVETPLGGSAEGQIPVKNRYLPLDPAIRGWANDARSYIPPMGVGEVMHAFGVGKVLVSKHPGFQTGGHVNGTLGVRDYFVGEPGDFYKVSPSRASLPRYLSALGVTSMAAYFALLDVSQPKSGETVVISGAAGTVGSAAGQITRLKDCRVVGITSGAERCRFLVEELGFDGAIGYRNEDLVTGLERGCPKGISMFFDNIGGEILGTILTRIAFRAHIVLCGAISQYNSKEAVRGPANYLSLLVNRARMEDMVAMDYTQRFPEGLKEVAIWLTESRLQSHEDIVEGLETFPEALLKLFSGGNFGKLVLKV